VTAARLKRFRWPGLQAGPAGEAGFSGGARSACCHASSGSAAAPAPEEGTKKAAWKIPAYILLWWVHGPRSGLPAVVRVRAGASRPGVFLARSHLLPYHPRCARRYVFNIVFNILNKSTLNAFPCPWFIATLQLGAPPPCAAARSTTPRRQTAPWRPACMRRCLPSQARVGRGSPAPPLVHWWLAAAASGAFMCVLWLTGLQEKPRVSKAFLLALLPVAFFHTVGHVSACVSFSHVSGRLRQGARAGSPARRPGGPGGRCRSQATGGPARRARARQHISAGRPAG
jgi:hypothetical protein